MPRLMVPSGTGKERQKGAIVHLLSDPLIHFLLIGAAVFGLYALTAPPVPTPQAEIVVTAADVARLKAQFRTTWNRDPAPTELDGLLENLIREEVLYREAKLFGLDQNDQVIRLRLRQKAELLLSQPSGLPAPTEAQLRAHFEISVSNYTLPSTISFQQLFLGERTQAEIAGVLAALNSGADTGTLGTPSLLPNVMSPSRQSEVDRMFGAGFFAVASAAPLGEWTGPVKSAFGQHVIRITGVTHPKVPPFESVRALVEADLLRIESEKAKEAAYQMLKARYRIDVSQITPAT